ncbi:MAG: rod shape-determining protein MreC [Legionellaceae bacterium]|nr:rod shape-determining protein MreC [Legionellaceae bacterium]
MAVISYRRNKKARLFNKRSEYSFIYGIVFFFSVLGIWVDAHTAFFRPLRVFFLDMAQPLQSIVDYPYQQVVQWRALFSDKSDLLHDNQRLQNEHLLLRAKLQYLLALENENTQLNALLQSAAQHKEQAMAARIVHVETNTARQLLVLNKGFRDGVYLGQPVLDAKGVVGQIIEAGSHTSSVLMISDVKSAIPVRNLRTGEWAILSGTNDPTRLAVVHLSRTAGMQVGDSLVSSGLGGRFLDGYPIGKVLSLKPMPGEDFVQVDVAPTALLQRDRLVLLVWPDRKERHLAQEILERMHALGETV